MTERVTSGARRRRSVGAGRADLAVERVALVWTPWRWDGNGIAPPAYREPNTSRSSAVVRAAGSVRMRRSSSPSTTNRPSRAFSVT